MFICLPCWGHPGSHRPGCASRGRRWGVCSSPTLLLCLCLQLPPAHTLRHTDIHTDVYTMHAHTHGHTQAHMYTHAHTHAHAHSSWTYTQVHTQMYTHARTHSSWTCMHTCIHMYTHAHAARTHTHYPHTLPQPLPPLPFLSFMLPHFFPLASFLTSQKVHIFTVFSLKVSSVQSLIHV